MTSKHKQIYPVRDRKHSNGAGTPLKRKVFVALSGGVDSSVAALLLQKQGYEVTGVYMKNWSEESFGGRFAKYCPWRRDLADVKAVCQKLDIHYKVYNFEREYNDRVINYFFDGEIRGETPNPDVVCNREIKFGLFLKRALAEGADYVATGHYAKRFQISDLRFKNKLIYGLKIAKDKNKDQSYFLCLLTQRQLAHSLFPLGDYLKSQVRQIARAARLSTAEKPESMGICFVGEIKMNDFLQARIEQTPGNIVSSKGEILGRHVGLPFYTIGQRGGLRIPGVIPWFVTEKRTKTNELVVAAGSRNPELFRKILVLKSFHSLVKTNRKAKFYCKVRIRHRQNLQNAIFKPGKNPKVLFKKSQRAITPGQFCAVYMGNKLLGGGEIKA